MNELTLLLTLATIHTIGLISPGPDFALVVQNVARYGRATGVYIACGLALGIGLHTIFSLTGVSFVIQQHETLFMLVQLAGGSYLLYLGLSALRSTYLSWHQPAAAPTQASTEQITSPHMALLKGLVTNLLNPKALVFFVSLVSTLVPASVSWWFKGTAALMLFALSLAWFSLLACWLSSSSMQQRLQRASRYIDAVCGTVFSLLGGSIVLSRVLG